MNFKIGDKIVNVSDHCVDFPIGAVAKVINVRPDLQGKPRYLEFVDLEGDIRTRHVKDYKIASLDDEIRHVQKQEKFLLARKAEEEKLKAAPKVGAKYRLTDSSCSWDGSVWMIAEISDKYCLICIEHNNSHNIGSPWEAKMSDHMNDVFGLYPHRFTKL